MHRMMTHKCYLPVLGGGQCEWRTYLQATVVKMDYSTTLVYTEGIDWFVANIRREEIDRYATRFSANTLSYVIQDWLEIFIQSSYRRGDLNALLR